MLKSYEHIIWDWNGTLLNDTELCVSIINNMLCDRELPEIDAKTYQQIFQFPVEGYYQKLGFDFSEEPFSQLVSQYSETYDSRARECELHCDVKEVLEGVAKLGISQSVLSALQHSSLLKEVQHHELVEYFDIVIGLNDNRAVGKIETGRFLIEHLELEPSRTVLVGDTAHDFEVASELGIDCILISHGHYSKDRLEAVHEYVVDSLEGLVPLDGI